MKSEDNLSQSPSPLPAEDDDESVYD
jgi:hypothetical protein